MQDILQNALQSLPDQCESESKLLVPMEAFEHMDTSQKEVSSMDALYELDKMMCGIVDKMQ